MSFNEYLILILANKISLGEDRLKAGSKKVFLVNKKIRIRIKSPNLAKAKNNSKITTLNIIIIKIKKTIVQYLKKMEVY
jgi:hypothetical protein